MEIFAAKEEILKVYDLNFKNFDMNFFKVKEFSKNNPKLFIQKIDGQSCR